jgi:hypothetical protein
MARFSLNATGRWEGPPSPKPWALLRVVDYSDARESVGSNPTPAAIELSFGSCQAYDER